MQEKFAMSKCGSEERGIGVHGEKMRIIKWKIILVDRLVY